MVQPKNTSNEYRVSSIEIVNSHRVFCPVLFGFLFASDAGCRLKLPPVFCRPYSLPAQPISACRSRPKSGLAKRAFYALANTQRRRQSQPAQPPPLRACTPAQRTHASPRLRRAKYYHWQSQWSGGRRKQVLRLHTTAQVRGLNRKRNPFFVGEGWHLDSRSFAGMRTSSCRRRLNKNPAINCPRQSPPIRSRTSLRRHASRG